MVRRFQIRMDAMVGAFRVTESELYDLFERALSGDQVAWALLFDILMPTTLTWAYKAGADIKGEGAVDAEDFVVDGWVRFWWSLRLNHAHFDSGKSYLVYLRSSVRSAVIDHNRRILHRRGVADLDYMFTSTVDIETVALQRATIADAWLMMDQNEQQTAIDDYEGYRPMELAEAYGTTASRISIQRVLLHQKMRRCFR